MDEQQENADNNIWLLEKEQVSMWLGLSFKIRDHLNLGHVFLIPEDGGYRPSVLASEIVQLIIAGVQVGIGIPKENEEE